MHPKHFLFSSALVFGLVCGSFIAQAENDTRIIAPGKQVVTSLQKCLDQLDNSDVADIRANYLKPWGECQKRLAIKKRKEQSAKAGDETEATAPETPRNYVRVQQTPRKTKGKATTDKATETKEKDKADK